jgi:hypothetical protein
MSELMRRFQWPIVILMLVSGAAFLLKMCYLSLAFNTIFGIAYLTAFYSFVRLRYGLVLPPAQLGLVLAGVEVDALGNFFRMYGRDFGPLHYDEFAHMTIQVLVTPLIVWLLREGLELCSPAPRDNAFETARACYLNSNTPSGSWGFSDPAKVGLENLPITNFLRIISIPFLLICHGVEASDARP